MNWNRLKNRSIARLITRFPALAKHLVGSYTPRQSEDIPWTPLTKPLSECTVAIVTTAGLHHKDQQPFDMIDRDGDPSCRIIDLGRPLDSLMITHDYYDHRDADRDINIVFPIERLKEFAEAGIIRQVSPRHYSFMGHIIGPHIDELVNRTSREAARRLVQDKVDFVLLTPG